MQFEISIQAQDLSDYVPAFGWEMAPPSGEQLKALEKNDINPETVDSAGRRPCYWNAWKSAGAWG